MFCKSNKQDKTAGLTLIELLVSIAVSITISAALYFSLRTAIDTWEITQDQLILQHVLSQTLEELSEGRPETYGLRDIMEIVAGDATGVSAVMPWTDNSHTVVLGKYEYTLNRFLKPGTGVPIAEVKLPNQKNYKLFPVRMVDHGRNDTQDEVALAVNLPPGSQMLFTYHPDYTKDNNVITTFFFEAADQAIFVKNQKGTIEITKNPFGVKIRDVQIKYFNNTNAEVSADENLSGAEIPAVTGIELTIIAESRQGTTRQAKTFISFRNAPMHSGNLSLKENSRFPIPSSKDVKALLLTNLYGIENNDELVLDARPKSGKDWRVSISFSKVSGGQPMIEYYSIEYPLGNKVFSDRPHTYAGLGLNLLSLGANGAYDYDDDGFEDSVILESPVEMRVKKMDITGGTLFVKP